jgi:hypothetical protein
MYREMQLGKQNKVSRNKAGGKHTQGIDKCRRRTPYLSDITLVDWHIKDEKMIM